MATLGKAGRCGRGIATVLAQVEIHSVFFASFLARLSEASIGKQELTVRKRLGSSSPSGTASDSLRGEVPIPATKAATGPVPAPSSCLLVVLLGRLPVLVPGGLAVEVTPDADNSDRSPAGGHEG